MALPARQPDEDRSMPAWRAFMVLGAVVVAFALVMGFGLAGMQREAKASDDARREQARAEAKRCEAAGGFPILSTNRMRLERCER